MKFTYSVETIIAIILITGFRLSKSTKEVVLTTKNGIIRGITNSSRSGREFRSFRGIPYAKPPIGTLRFKNPQPYGKWNADLDATKEGPFCIQKNVLFKDAKVEGSEDCLYLNVYVPQVNSSSKHVKKLLPVMVNFHWGAFFAGRGTSDYAGPEYLMDKDVIVVTLNYRLGVLGFFTTLDDNAPGNYGMKDQVLALKWVQENIEDFSGDPNKVTIFGASAGSGSVHLHMISPISKGLFNQAISESGVALDLWARPTNLLQPNVTAAQAYFVGCDEFLLNSDELVNCLQQIDAATLVQSSDYFKTFDVEPLTVYSIVTETKTEANPNPFLTEDPLKLLVEGEFQKVPWMTGVCQDEGIIRAAPLTRKSNILEELNTHFDEILPQILMLQLSVGPFTEDLFKNITDFYLDGEHKIDTSNPNSVQGFTNLYTDRSFVYGQYQSVMIQAFQGHDSIWFYNFNYKGTYSYVDLFAATDENIDFDWGVSHLDDTIYLFKSPALFPKLTEKLDIEVSEKLIELWTNFAIFGSPEGANNLMRKRDAWRPVKITDEFENDQLYYLNITGNIKSNSIAYNYQNGFLTDRMNFWLSQNIAENNFKCNFIY